MEAGHPGNAPVILRVQATPALSGVLPDVTLKTPLRIFLSTPLQEELAQHFAGRIRLAPVASPGVLSAFVEPSP